MIFRPARLPLRESWVSRIYSRRRTYRTRHAIESRAFVSIKLPDKRTVADYNPRYASSRFVTILMAATNFIISLFTQDCLDFSYQIFQFILGKNLLLVIFHTDLTPIISIVPNNTVVFNFNILRCKYYKFFSFMRLFSHKVDRKEHIFLKTVRWDAEERSLFVVNGKYIRSEGRRMIHASPKPVRHVTHADYV